MKAKLTLKFNKCQFLQNEVNYLRHVITPDGIKPEPAKIEQIKNYKTPTSVDGVRSFLWLVGYFRKFSPDFGGIAKPLTRKTHKDQLKQPFIWTEEDQKVFKTLRDRLLTPPSTYATYLGLSKLLKIFYWRLWLRNRSRIISSEKWRRTPNCLC